MNIKQLFKLLIDITDNIGLCSSINISIEGEETDNEIVAHLEVDIYYIYSTALEEKLNSLYDNRVGYFDQIHYEVNPLVNIILLPEEES